jgi:hypothetical protein
MKDGEIQAQLNELFKIGFWNSRYWNEIRRIHNISNAKQKPKVRKIISEAIASKAVLPRHSRSYRRFLTKGSFEPYAVFMRALFQPKMEKELAQVLNLVLFSESAISTGSRKAVELAMKSYPKAIGWNDETHVNELNNAVQTIEQYDLQSTDQNARESLQNALETILNTEVKTSQEIITIKAYSKLSSLQVRFQNTDLAELTMHTFNKACNLI